MAFRCSACCCCRVSFSKLYVTLLALKQAHDRPTNQPTDRPESPTRFRVLIFIVMFWSFLFFPSLFFFCLYIVVFRFNFLFLAIVVGELESELKLNLKSKNAHKSFYVVSQVKTTAVVRLKDGTYPWHNSIEPLNMCIQRNHSEWRQWNHKFLLPLVAFRFVVLLLAPFSTVSQWPVKRLIWNLSQTLGS